MSLELILFVSFKTTNFIIFNVRFTFINIKKINVMSLITWERDTYIIIINIIQITSVTRTIKLLNQIICVKSCIALVFLG